MTSVRITGGGYSAAIDLHGGGLRQLQHRGRAVAVTSPAGEHPAAWEGRILAPWPNRLADGRYEVDGRAYEVGVNEPSRRNALHGLVWELMWEVADRSTSHALIVTTLDPSPGYPWRLEIAADYTIDTDGLTLSIAATNRSDDAAPFGCGFHPYLGAPGGDLDACILSLVAEDRLEVSADRLLPTGRSPVGSTSFDFSDGRPIGDTVFDTAFTGFVSDADGRTTVRISAPSGREAVQCWWDRAFTWVQLYTPEPDHPGGSRTSMAIEPMTCPADAFNSGTDLIRLEPGGTWSGTLGIRSDGSDGGGVVSGTSATR